MRIDCHQTRICGQRSTYAGVHHLPVAVGAGRRAGRPQLLHLRCRQLVQRDLVEGDFVIERAAAAIAVLHNSSIKVCMLTPWVLRTPLDRLQPIQSRQWCGALRASTSCSATAHNVGVQEQLTVKEADPARPQPLKVLCSTACTLMSQPHTSPTIRARKGTIPGRLAGFSELTTMSQHNLTMVSFSVNLRNKCGLRPT